MKTRLIAAVLCVLLLVPMLCACSAAPQQPAQEPSVPETAEAPAVREFTDSLGRTVQLPEKIEKVAISGPLTQIYVFPLCPELLVGFSTAFSEDAQKYIPEQYLALPELGQLYGGKGTMNLEALLGSGAQVVIDVGEAKDGMAQALDELTEQTGIPFVHINATVTTSAQAYRMMGELLGQADKAEALAAWCENTVDDISGIMEKVDAVGARKSVVYCLGPKGLNVLAEKSFHAQIVSLVAHNAADIESPVPSGDGNEIDMEQLILWDPDVLIFQHGSVYDEVAGSDTWAKLRAVADGEYYEIPIGPYGWLSSPPAVQCYLGMLWLTAVLYPEYIDYDLQQSVTEYYELFYGYELSDADYGELIG